jgi:hypothetical protein
MAVADDLLHTLRTWGRLPAGALLSRLGVSRPTLMRAVHALGPSIISLGAARRTTYAARRTIRGNAAPLPWYAIDETGHVDQVATVYPTHPAGCAVGFEGGSGGPPVLAGWHWDTDMAAGWFDGLPYPLEDLRPAGFMGRNFARANAAVLQVAEDPRDWSEDDVLHALSILGADQPGNFVLGEPVLRSWLSQSVEPVHAIGDAQVELEYPALAEAALTQGYSGSSAGGDFPKFTAVRASADPQHVIVKFSGSDDSPATQRWADLLVCEHLASQVIRGQLGLESAETTIVRAGGRTFLEVRRFDRHGATGRSAVCSWSALDGGLFGMGNRPWTEVAKVLHESQFLDEDQRHRIERLWFFGRLIANADMHPGNLSFRPGFTLAPAYDMLPMLYAPGRGVELATRAFAPAPPIPTERPSFASALPAAVAFWEAAAADARISPAFRAICGANAHRLRQFR